MLEIMKQLSEFLNTSSPDNIRLWQITNRYNNTVRPLSCIDCTHENSLKTISDFTKQESSWIVFVETANDLSFSKTFDYLSLLNTTPANKLQYPLPASPSTPQLSPPSPSSPPAAAAAAAQSPSVAGGGSQQLSSANSVLPPFSSKEDVMIFFKFYDPKTSTLRYVFRMHLPINLTLDAIQEKINKKMKFAPHTELLFYEEVKITQITPLVQRGITLEQLAHEQLLDGDIYVFQLNEKEKFEDYKLPLVPDYFK